MTRPLKPSVHEESGATVWVSRYRRPMNGEPEMLFFDGFVRESDARAFKERHQHNLRDDAVICLTFERPPGAASPKRKLKSRK